MDDISPYCGTDNVKLLIMVASAPKNIVARNVIRETWGSKQVLWEKGCRLLFMLGRSDNATVDVGHPLPKNFTIFQEIIIYYILLRNY